MSQEGLEGWFSQKIEFGYKRGTFSMNGERCLEGRGEGWKRDRKKRGQQEEEGKERPVAGGGEDKDMRRREEGTEPTPSLWKHPYPVFPGIAQKLTARCPHRYEQLHKFSLNL